MGFMYQVLNFKDPQRTEVEDRFSMYAFNIGAYYTLLHRNDVFSVGVDGSVQPGITFSGNGYISWQAQVPVYLMGRIGANATTYNEQRFGFAAGIGAAYTYASLDYVAQLNATQLVRVKRKASFINPAVVIQATLGSFTGRAQFAISPASTELNQEFGGRNSTVPTNATQFSLGLTYGF